ncbi:hypothetical protein [Helicobacter sp. L8]|uniref:hypothetical protein n=1 Tax=Helicobacter sp. L8 TaxID=2316078 RepID=UPI000EAC162F|nr:hypothetical protein [Helicobacter sp. L8]
MVYYALRLSEFLDQSYYYTFDNQHAKPQLDIPILQKHSQLCFKPRYLRQKFQQACLDIFTKHTYDSRALKHYVKKLSLVNINDTPCLL